MYDYHLRFASRRAIDQATQVLALFRNNANLGKGIGIDEYEHVAAPHRKFSPVDSLGIAYRRLGN